MLTFVLVAALLGADGLRLMALWNRRNAK